MGPPQVTPARSILRSPLPSDCTTHSELRRSALTRRENTIALPCGDQSPGVVMSMPGGVIGRAWVPSLLSTYRPIGPPSSSKRPKTSRLPLGA